MASQPLLFSRSFLLLPLRFARRTTLARFPTTPTGFLAPTRVLLGVGVRPVRRLRAVMLFAEDPLVHDVCASALTAGVALALLRFWEEMAKRQVFEQVLCFPDFLVFTLW